MIIILKSPVSKRINFKKLNKVGAAPRSHAKAFPFAGPRCNLLNSAPLTLHLNLEGNFQCSNFIYEVNMENKPAKFAKDITLDTMLATARKWHAQLNGSLVSQTRITKILLDKQFRQYETELIVHFSRQLGAGQIVTRRDDLNELINKLAALHIVFADSKLEILKYTLRETFKLTL